MKVAIIGGGAAGLMTAATIREVSPETEVFLIEKNDGLGKKVIISGGGRCNVTTGITDVRTVLTRYPRGNKFLSSAMYAFPPDRVFAWFEDHGVPLKVEEDLRVFPQSNNGRDVVGVFERLFHSSTIGIRLKTNVIRVERAENQFQLFFKDQTDPLVVDRLVLTTGGQAYRHTGSTGDGYAFAQTLGHTITPLAASLNAFFTREQWPAEISGLSFERAKITATREGDFSWTGPFLFTHKGISGPAVFAVSGLVAFETYDQSHPLEVSIDLFPDASDEELIRLLIERIAETPKKNLPNGLTGLVPKSLTEILCRENGLSLEKHAGEFSKKELMQVAHWLKNIKLQVIARGPGDEFVTAGGVDLKEVNPSTMESKLCPGLYFAGEILDVDGFTGGFNLQASWATGRLAGQHVIE
ncbi:aminoacetone oxidase family FAD-binding enzyme [Patescibacteria group bacterium]|nr:aminoacetone oxidase family FAD-binding enzyme [Patescibacteria group bacterium]